MPCGSGLAALFFEAANMASRHIADYWNIPYGRKEIKG
jgi:hypothetical protein